MENKTEMMQRVLKCSKFPCFPNTQNEFLGFVLANAGCITVKMGAIHTARIAIKFVTYL